MVSICSQIEQPFSCIFLAPAQLHQWTVEIWLQPPHIRGVKTVCAGSPLKSKFSCKRRPHKSTTCSVLLDSWVNKTNTSVFHYLFHRKKSKRPSSQLLERCKWLCLKWPFSAQTTRFYFYECNQSFSFFNRFENGNTHSIQEMPDYLQ